MPFIELFRALFSFPAGHRSTVSDLLSALFVAKVSSFYCLIGYFIIFIVDATTHYSICSNSVETCC